MATNPLLGPPQNPLLAGGTNPLLDNTPNRAPSGGKFQALANAQRKLSLTPTPIKSALAGLQWAASSPVARGADAVLNATQRVVGGPLAGENPLQAVLNPQTQTQRTHKGEQNVAGFADRTMFGGAPVASTVFKAIQSNPITSGLQDFGYETATDLSTYVPGLDAFSIGKRALQLGKLGAKVSGASRLARAVNRVPVVAKATGAIGKKATQLQDAFVEGNALRRAVTRPGEDIVKGHEGAGRNAVSRAEQQYADLVERHRPELEAIDAQRATAAARLKELKAMETGLEPQEARFIRNRNAAEAAELNATLEKLNEQVPQEIRTALLQRAYREGTPEVRRKALAAGYKPTADEAAHPPLNVLHGFNDIYEPTQKVMKPEDLERTAGAVRTIRQGNRKGSFDLRKTGATPEDPLADRVLDRLVRGARLESYHATRRNILRDLGLNTSQLSANAQRATEAAAAAHAAGDTVRATKYAALVRLQNEALKRAEALRAKTLKPGAEMATQGLEIVAPGTAREQALRGLKREGAKGIVPGAAPKPGAPTQGFLRQTLARGGVNADELLGRASGATRAIKALDRAHIAAVANRLRTGKAMNKLYEGLDAKAERQGTERLPPKAPSGLSYTAMRRSTADLASRKKAAQEAGQQVLQRLQEIRATQNTLKGAEHKAKTFAKTVNDIAMPSELQQRLFGDRQFYQKNTILTALSDLQRDALFLLPFAHMKNITVLAALGPGGAKTVARGIKYAHDLRTNPAALAERVKGLESVGATQHYIREHPSAFEHIPGPIGKAIGKGADASNAALERYDLGMRLALEDELAAKGIHGFEAGGQIRDVLGDYVNQAPAVQALRNGLGANFPGWRLGVVPRAMTKALREQPRAFKAYARGQRLLSDDVVQPTLGTDFDAGGPGEDYAKMFEAPSYYTSPSTLGFVSDLFRGADAFRQGKLGEFGSQEALKYAPYSATIETLLNYPYPSAAPTAVRAGAGLFGSFFPDKKDARQRAAQLRELGLKGADIARILQAEGYGAGGGALQPMQIPTALKSGG